MNGQGWFLNGQGWLMNAPQVVAAETSVLRWSRHEGPRFMPSVRRHRTLRHSTLRVLVGAVAS